MPHRYPGALDLARAADALASRIPAPLAPLARLAFNLRWAWTPGAPDLFEQIDPHRWELSAQNPVRLLREVSSSALNRAASDAAFVERVHAQGRLLDAELNRPSASQVPVERPVAFFCAEFGLHRALPIYSGGLGVLAGDILKEASDQALPLVGIGLFYRLGYFHQRLDLAGWQHEYWIEADPPRLPAALVTDDTGQPVRVRVPIWGREVLLQCWRVDVGRVPLYLLDAELAENRLTDRFITARLYEGNRALRLAQYAVLGIGGARLLAALGIDPWVMHLNEGHAALAAFERASVEIAAGASFDEALGRVRDKLVFTTHTPVAAGNETYAESEILAVFPDLAHRLKVDSKTFLGLGRISPENLGEPMGMTALAIRVSRSTNGVAARHGGVSREMWRSIFPGRAVDEVPITHVTNGVHLPTWMSPAFRALLDKYFPADWVRRSDDPEVWKAVDQIPDEELWAARTAAKKRLLETLRRRSVQERLLRGEPLDYVESAARQLEDNALTLGFARRLATYKRIHLLAHDPNRALGLLGSGVQLIVAGKAHPMDEGGKRSVQSLFQLKRASEVSGRVAFIEDYDMGVAAALVSGCDVWINLPRPPLEASGTSGMKSMLNGGLNLSVLDGWWAEAYDGMNGWAIDGGVDPDDGRKDHNDASSLYWLLENEVIPEFKDRDERGIPRRWVARMKASLRSLGWRFSSARMVSEYERRIYAP